MSSSSSAVPVWPLQQACKRDVVPPLVAWLMSAPLPSSSPTVPVWPSWQSGDVEGCESVFVGLVEVYTLPQQTSGRVYVPAVASNVEGCVSVLVGLIDVGTLAQQQPSRVRVPVLESDVEECKGMQNRVRLVHRAPAHKKQYDHHANPLRITPFAGLHQRSMRLPGLAITRSLLFGPRLVLDACSTASLCAHGRTQLPVGREGLLL